MRAFLTALTFSFLAACSASAEILEIQYEGFKVWVDCDRRGPVLFHYVASTDTGNIRRHSRYYWDSSVAASCQSASRSTFQSVLRENGISGVYYDVGHQAPANHLDGSYSGIRQTNYWTNLLPQTKSMNRGAWLETEHIIECMRDHVDVEVWGGPIWGSNFDDDYFVDSHGVRTPSAYWKVLIRTDTRAAMAWIIDNGHAPRSSLDNWIQSVAMIELVTGRTFDAIDKDVVPTESWERMPGCDIS